MRDPTFTQTRVAAVASEQASLCFFYSSVIKQFNITNTGLDNTSASTGWCGCATLCSSCAWSITSPPSLRLRQDFSDSDLSFRFSLSLSVSSTSPRCTTCVRSFTLFTLLPAFCLSHGLAFWSAGTRMRKVFNCAGRSFLDGSCIGWPVFGVGK